MRALLSIVVVAILFKPMRAQLISRAGDRSICADATEFETEFKMEDEFVNVEKTCGELDKLNECHLTEMKRHCIGLQEHLAQKCPEFSVQECEKIMDIKWPGVVYSFLFERHCVEACVVMDDAQCVDCRLEQASAANFDPADYYF